MAEYKSNYTGEQIDAGITKAYQAVEAVQNSGDEGIDGSIKIIKGSTIGSTTVLYVKPKNINNGAYRDVDTEIASGSTSQNLPTSQAVANFVSSHSGSNILVKEIDYSNPEEWNSEEEQPTAEVIDDILDNKYTLIHIYNIVIDEGVSVEMYLVSSGMIDVEESGVARYYYKFDEGDEDEETSPNIEQYLFVHQEGENAQMIVENFELGGGDASWGSITGTLSNQTDLKNVLDSKGTYSKPSGGIPENDLSSDVQAKLNSGGGTSTDAVKDRALLENIRQLSNLSTFPLYPIQGNVAILGDSTIAGQASSKIATLISVASGYTITDLSVSGDTIGGQLSKWNNLSASVKSNLTYVFVEVGINDVSITHVTSTIKNAYTNLINKIKQDTSNAEVIICTMTPCKGRWKSLYGNNWQLYETVFEEVNDSIKNNEYGASKVCYLHTEAMAYDKYLLRPEYDSGDHLHENTAGAKVIAYCWYSTAMDNSEIGAVVPTISSIAVTTPPTKTSYTTDEYFDPTGMVVTATWSDSSTSVVTGYTYSPTTLLTVETTAITISYAGKTTTTPITVTASTKELVSIEATYTQGQAVVYPSTPLDDLKSDLVVVATYDDTSTTTLQDNDYTLSGTLLVGTSTITATFEGKTDTFNVTVTEQPVLTSLTHSGTLAKTTYNNGEAFDPTGLTFTATFDDSSSQTVSPTFSPSTLSTGDTSVTASYTFGGITETDTITGITVTDGIWVYANKNNMSHSDYLAISPVNNLNGSLQIYMSDTSYFEGKTVTKVCVKGNGATITLYANPISASPTTEGRIEVGTVTTTAVGGLQDYNVSNPQQIPAGYTLAFSYDNLMNIVPATQLTIDKVDIKYSSSGSSGYSTSLQIGGPDFYVE